MWQYEFYVEMKRLKFNVFNFRLHQKLHRYGLDGVV